MSEEKIYHYPWFIRIWHLANAILCLFLIITGISMQFSNPKYPLIRFDVAVTIHNVVGILLTVNYFIFFAGNIFTPNGKHYKVVFKGLRARLMSQFRYYTKGIFKGQPAPFPVSPERKFNPLQHISYAAIMYVFVPLTFLTGWAMLFPDVIPMKIMGISGLHLNDLFHVISGFIISMFMFVHIYFCTIGKSPLSNFKSILNGYQEIH